MTERIQTLSGAQACAAQLLEAETSELLAQRFGSGHPYFIGGEQPKTYHTLYHGKRVASNTVLLGSVIGLTPAEIIVCGLAGLAHDAVQDLGEGPNEAATAEWFEHKLHNTGFEPYLVQMGGLAINATVPRYNDRRRLIHQRVIEMDFPTKQSEQAARALTSADIGDAFLPSGPYDAHRLFQEIHKVGPNDEPPLDKFAAFAINQLEMIEEFELPLDVANSVFCQHRSEVRHYVHTVAERAANNQIPTFAELLAQDQAFARSLLSR